MDAVVHVITTGLGVWLGIAALTLGWWLFSVVYGSLWAVGDWVSSKVKKKS